MIEFFEHVILRFLDLIIFIYFFLFKNVFLMFFFEKEGDRASRRGAERERYRIQRRLQALSLSAQPDTGLKPTKGKIMT